MIKPNEVLVMMPVADGRNESQTTIGLFQIASFGMAKNLGTLPHCSNVALARNLCANGFLRTEFEWLFFLDYDIGFTADDFAIMMEYPGAPPPLDQELHDAATLIEVTPHNKPSFKTPLIVAAEYARKQKRARRRRGWAWASRAFTVRCLPNSISSIWNPARRASMPSCTKGSTCRIIF